ncbi:hypothetical protein OG342_15305 [Streptomyces bobili]|uniref:hypothetical protein n=1 Tax=Streptomyces bobili TaxID=67280 RepID=UPI002254DF21|nr:hypothetical protein [Streptomyces bobili]MCX5524222.1 hypothetical protein [Streptomyces bobili]
MRSLLAAILSLFLPPRGAHRSLDRSAFPAGPAQRPAPACRRRPYAPDVILADGLPLVRPYLDHVPSGAAV